MAYMVRVRVANPAFSKTSATVMLPADASQGSGMWQQMTRLNVHVYIYIYAYIYRCR